MWGELLQILFGTWGLGSGIWEPTLSFQNFPVLGPKIWATFGLTKRPSFPFFFWQGNWKEFLCEKANPLKIEG